MQCMKHFNSYRGLIAGVDTRIPLMDGKYANAINFDNAATTPPFLSVLEKIMDFSPWYASVHRGAGYKSQLSSSLYEEARSVVADFVGADLNHQSVVFVKNTTEAINKLSNRLFNIDQDAVILSTWMEHHSNDLPWRNKYTVDYVAVDKNGVLSITDLEEKLKKHNGRVRLVAVTGASNVTGYMNPIHRIATIAHTYDAKILVDGAQLVPHAPIDMLSPQDAGHIDYLVFSGHKMYAPFGTGVLIGPKKAFQQGTPDSPGGGTVEFVTHDYVKWQPPPLKEEAGTPNVMGVIALATSIDILKRIDMSKIEAYEKQLTDYTLHQLETLPNIQLFQSPGDYHQRVSIIPFNVEGMDHNLVANILSYEAGISVRNGCFCAQPYVQKLLNVPKEEVKKRIKDDTMPHIGLVRISYGLYNTYQEVDVMIKLLRQVVANRNYYIEKYNKILNFG